MSQGASAAERRLAALGLALPAPLVQVQGQMLYQRTRPFVRVGSLVFLSGQGPIEGSTAFKPGRLGCELDLDDGIAAARLCGLHLLVQLRAACDGDLDRVVQVVRLTVFVASAPEFTGQSSVATGVSQLMIDAFGGAGRHARTAVGVAALPFDVPVEVDGIFEIR